MSTVPFTRRQYSVVGSDADSVGGLVNAGSHWQHVHFGFVDYVILILGKVQYSGKPVVDDTWILQFPPQPPGSLVMWGTKWPKIW